MEDAKRWYTGLNRLIAASLPMNLGPKSAPRSSLIPRDLLPAPCHAKGNAMDNDATNNPLRSPKPDHFHLSAADQELFQAVKLNDKRRVSTALAHGADVNAKEVPLERTPLFYAVRLPDKNAAMAELLLAKGADPRARSQDRVPPRLLRKYALRALDDCSGRWKVPVQALSSARDNDGVLETVI